jgi:hypothetical protein
MTGFTFLSMNNKYKTLDIIPTRKLSKICKKIKGRIKRKDQKEGSKGGIKREPLVPFPLS